MAHREILTGMTESVYYGTQRDIYWHGTLFTDFTESVYYGTQKDTHWHDRKCVLWHPERYLLA